MRKVDTVDLTGEGLEDVTVAVFYFVIRSRNGWHSVESRQYLLPESLAASKRGAFRAAERWRERGSSFRIEQLPGLLLETESFLIPVLDVHSNDPFDRWDASKTTALRSGVPITQVIHALSPQGIAWSHPRPRDSGVVTAVMDEHDDSVDLLDEEAYERWESEHAPFGGEPWFDGETSYFTRWQSTPAGPGRPLLWHPTDGRHTADTVRSIMYEFNPMR